MESIIDYVKKLVAETPEANFPSALPDGFSIQSLPNVRKVTKPWGFELWLSGATETPYAFKLIYLKEGTRTSLQLHREKSEHNFVLAGEVRWYYEHPETGAIDSVVFSAGNIAEVLPNTVHRVEALSDVILIEASSHHLDDVVRLADDYGRPDGKIETEHQG